MAVTRVALLTSAMGLGGIETYILKLAGFLARQDGIEVEVVTVCDQGEWFDQISAHGLVGKHIPGYRRSIPYFFTSTVARWIEAQHYDVLLINKVKHVQAALAQLPDSIVAIPVVHGDTKHVYQIACANAEAWNVLVGISPKLCAEAQRRVPDRPVCYIPNGVDLPTQAAVATRVSHSTALRLLYVGRFNHSQKGVLLLPDILHRCAQRGIDATLTLVGGGKDEAELRRRFTRLGLDSRVTFRGALPPEAVTGEMLAAHVLLFPSFTEGAGLVLLEAQGCGCVPVASLLPDVTDVIVRHGSTGLLTPPGQPEGFVNAIAQLSYDGTLWQRMSLAGRAHVEAEFSTEAMGNAYLSLMRQALAGNYPLPTARKQLPRICRQALTSRDFYFAFLSEFECYIRHKLHA